MLVPAKQDKLKKAFFVILSLPSKPVPGLPFIVFQRRFYVIQRSKVFWVDTHDIFAIFPLYPSKVISETNCS